MKWSREFGACVGSVLAGSIVALARGPLWAALAVQQIVYWISLAVWK